MFSHHISIDLIGHLRWSMDWATVEVLDASGVILTEPEGVGVAIEGRHDGARFQRVLQAQNVPKLVSCHLQQIRAYIEEERMNGSIDGKMNG